MLLRIILENFLSFREEQEFNMFPNPKIPDLKKHIYNKKVKILKQASIYGDNASGKSNLIKAAFFIKEFVKNKSFLSKKLIEKYIHRPNLSSQKERTIKILVEFEFKKEYYKYKTIINTKEIKEYLYLSGLGKEDNLIISRENEVIFLGDNLTDSDSYRINILKDILNDSKNKYSSIFSILKEFPIIKNKYIRNARSWFESYLEIIDISTQIPRLISILQKEKELLNFAKEIFQKTKIGVDNIEILTTEAEEWMSEHIGEFPIDGINRIKDGELVFNQTNPFRPILKAAIENDIKYIYELLFQQIDRANIKHEYDVTEQSDGTIRLLMLIPEIYEAIKKGKTVIIDEINHCLHSKLVFDLIKFYSKSKTNGQLIFTTHEVDLMKTNSILRIDEIWFINKKFGESSLYSLNEFDLPINISIDKAYKEGRFGAIYKGSLEKYE